MSTASGEMPILRVDGLRAGYGAAQVLHGVSLEVREGEAVAIIGPNGAGKSTLLKVLSGLVRAREGAVSLRGRDMTNAASHRLVSAGVVHVPEGRQVFPEMSVRTNLTLGGFAARQGAAQRLEEVLDLFPRLRERIGQSADTLSGGEQQMLAVGRGLMANPAVLLLDEPTLGLAPIVVEEVLERLRAARQTLRTSMLVAEQNAYLTRELCDRYYVLINGRIVREGTEMPDDPAEIMAEFLGGADLVQ
jgi:branched-chain amino acid transport system ATP-binding protein